MSIVDLDSLNLDNLPQLHTLPDGAEAKLRITEAMSGVGQSGLTWYRFRCEVVGDEEAQEITIFVTIPDATVQETKKFRYTAERYVDFLRAFGLPTKGAVNMDSDPVGKEAWALLSVKEGQRGLENDVKRWVAPK